MIQTTSSAPQARRSNSCASYSAARKSAKPGSPGASVVRPSPKSRAVASAIVCISTTTSGWSVADVVGQRGADHLAPVAELVVELPDGVAGADEATGRRPADRHLGQLGALGRELHQSLTQRGRGRVTDDEDPRRTRQRLGKGRHVGAGAQQLTPGRGGRDGGARRRGGRRRPRRIGGRGDGRRVVVRRLVRRTGVGGLGAGFGVRRFGRVDVGRPSRPRRAPPAVSGASGRSRPPRGRRPNRPRTPVARSAAAGPPPPRAR